ncbi:GNAT family N-acetyltransferase [Kaistia sp. MMO-174]|uniref:GNAT family N-acetyltransferase n=1 Tax=Kaistia sp. MMO-174 TaxID=3081256 RepID=UPI001AD35DBC|nr:GNAT family N-acetyltransferase [Hyphomicrobiales bacterium]MBN9058575.1 GNAT family N-acetyltransferase [Hyphomicrobiales bacterium]
MPEIEVVRATESDIPFIVATERRPGFESLVGRWEAAQHAEAMTEPRYAYFLARALHDGGEPQPLGFALLRDWNGPERSTLLKRIAVAEPGRGNGTALLHGLIDRVFGETQAHRLSLGLFPHNLRARRAYESAGFQAEGISRGSAFVGGEHHDELVMAILRPDWLARKT